MLVVSVAAATAAGSTAMCRCILRSPSCSAVANAPPATTATAANVMAEILIQRFMSVSRIDSGCAGPRLLAFCPADALRLDRGRCQAALGTVRRKRKSAILGEVNGSPQERADVRSAEARQLGLG